MSKKSLLSLAGLLAAIIFCGGAVASAQTAQGGQEREAARRALSEVILAGGGNFIGVHTEDVTRENMGRFQLSGEPRGVGVAEVVADGPAAKAGLQKGDVIVRFDGEAVTSAAKLRRLISEASPEHTARLTILRGGAEREFSVKLGSREAGAHGVFRFPEGQVFRFDGDGWRKFDGEEWRKQAEQWKKQAEEWKKQGDAWEKRGGEWRLRGDELRKQLENMPQGNFSVAFGPRRRIGVSTTQLTEQLADYFGVSERRGLLVTSVAADSPAAKAGLKAGDVITEADGEKLDDAAELSRVIGRKEEGDVTLTVVRERSRRTVRVTPEKRETPETFVLPARPTSRAFALPRAVARGTRTLVLPTTPAPVRTFRPVRPTTIAPRALAPLRTTTIL